MSPTMSPPVTAKELPELPEPPPEAVEDPDAASPEDSPKLVI